LLLGRANINRYCNWFTQYLELLNYWYPTVFTARRCAWARSPLSADVCHVRI